ncbi:MAG TPA: ABC transporter ATP-binding protein [Candidatus Angelobacter sp.]|jgi:ABC-type multidrug transport system fused ATPase/permease subunit|nr:ABC transporter ATP-binding protein [Candidatus Angelobacter sp.]
MQRLLSKEVCWLLLRMKPLWRLQALSIASIFASSILTLIGPLILKWLIDHVLPGRSLGLLLLGAAGYGLSVAGQLTFSYAGYVFSYLLGEKLAFRIRFSRLRSLHGVSAEYYDRIPLGETQYRLEQDISQVGALGSEIAASVLRMITTAAMILMTMWALNLQLTLLVMPMLPLFYFLQRKYFFELRSAADAAQVKMSGVSTLLQEHLSGLIQLQLLNKAEFHAGKLARLAADGVRARMNQRASEVRFSAASMAVIVMGSTGILGYGGYEVMHGALTIGGLVAFYTYLTQLFGPLTAAVDVQSRMQRVSASLRRVLEVGEAVRPVTALVRNRCMATAQAPSVEFKTVSFMHRSRGLTLDSLQLVIDEGEKIVLVGHSGCGKSTLVQLAAGLYSPASGSVRVLGRDVRCWGHRSLRSQLALVPQEPVLFDGTLRENLLYGNPRATAKELARAAEMAELDSVLLGLPAGLDEALGPGGKRLSGGEKKRVALARAILQTPRILILDELTSALDGLTALRMMERLKEYLKERTVIVVSHRPTSIIWATRIVVLGNGQVLDSGTHQELTQRCPEYLRLYTAPCQ